MNIKNQDFSFIRELLHSRQISCESLTEDYLNAIAQHGHLNTFITVFAKKALERAAKVDQKLRRGNAGMLAGMVLGIKDNIVIKGEKVTCGSAMLKDFVSLYDATVINKLMMADVIVIGKTNMDEFAMGSSNETSYFGIVRNPWNENCVPGGSSGGAAAAVAAGLCTAALGSDTGGSIRQPAAFCGVVGLKPTYGRVSRFGLVAFASSLDQIGPITKSVRDAALLLQVMSGYDQYDSTSVDTPVPNFSEQLELRDTPLTIGIPVQYFFNEGLNEEVKNAILDTINVIKSSQIKVVEISLPHTEYAIATYYTLADAEASSNLARYDGARYGFRAQNIQNLTEMYVKSRGLGFGKEVKRRIMLGTYVLSAGYYEAYYRKAQKVRTLIKSDFDNAFNKVDCVITPTSPTTAFRIGEKIADPMAMYLSDVCTVSANLAGLPAISVPCGYDSQGLPIGLQIIGRPFDEATILKVACLVEKSGVHVVTR